jgi:hypothetical protein
MSLNGNSMESVASHTGRTRDVTLAEMMDSEIIG